MKKRKIANESITLQEGFAFLRNSRVTFLILLLYFCLFLCIYIQLAMADGFVLVYSITSPTSLEMALKLRKNILDIKMADVCTTNSQPFINYFYVQIPIMLVGNNCHLDSERTVSTEEVQMLAGKSPFPSLFPPSPSFPFLPSILSLFISLVYLIYSTSTL